MAINFSDLNGKAKKQEVDYFKFVDGDNSFRMVGDILPRYVYWIKTNTGNNVPIECLSFDRVEERFLNQEHDWIPETEELKSLRCSWAYAVNVIDPADGTIKVLALKKKMFEQIKTAAEDLGDPTDPETGYTIHVKRTKTGSQAYNVEYQVKVLKLKPTPLTDAEKELVAEMTPIETQLPRPTPEDQKRFIDRYVIGVDESAEDASEEIDELDRLMHAPDDDIEGFYDDLELERLKERPSDDSQPLIPRTPQPRKRKVSIYDLVNALNKALEVKERRVLRQLPVTDITRPAKSVDIHEFMGNLFNRLMNVFNKGKK